MNNCFSNIFFSKKEPQQQIPISRGSPIYQTSTDHRLLIARSLTVAIDMAAPLQYETIMDTFRLIKALNKKWPPKHSKSRLLQHGDYSRFTSRWAQNSRDISLAIWSFSCNFRQWRIQEFCSGGGSTNSIEDTGQRERGSESGSPLVRGSGGSCNLVQEISFRIVKFS